MLASLKTMLPFGRRIKQPLLLDLPHISSPLILWVSEGASITTSKALL